MGNGSTCCINTINPSYSLHSLIDEPRDLNIEDLNPNDRNEEILSHLSSLRFKQTKNTENQNDQLIKQIYTRPTSTITSTIFTPSSNQNQKQKTPKKQKTTTPVHVRAASTINKVVTKERRKLQKAFSVDKNIIQHFHYIVHNNLNDFSKKMNLNTGVFENVFPRFKDNTREFAGDDLLKLSYEEIQEPFSADQITMIKRILTEEEMIIDAMDDNTKERIVSCINYIKIKLDSVFYSYNSIRNMQTLTKDNLDKASDIGSFRSKIEDNNKDQYFFIIEQGTIEMTIDDKVYLLEKEDVISTKALIKNTQNYCILVARSRRAFVFQLPLELYAKIFMRFINKTKEDKISLLKKIYLFANLEKDALSKISEECSRETTTKPKFLIKEDKTNKNVYYIIKGKISLLKGDKLIRVYGKNKVIGELSLFKSMSSLFGFKAEKDTEYLKIKYEHIKKAFKYNELTSKTIGKNIFYNAIKTSRILRKYFQNERQLQLLYKIFRTKYYKYNELIATSKNPKIFIPLGGLIYRKVIPNNLNNNDNDIHINYVEHIEIDKFYVNGEICGEDLLGELKYAFNEFTNETDQYEKTLTTVWSGECLVLETTWNEILKSIQCNTFFGTNIHSSGSNSNLTFHLNKSTLPQPNLPNLSSTIISSSSNYYSVSMYDKVNYLRKVPYIRDKSEISLFVLAENLKSIMFKEGEIILKNGPISSRLYIITQGQVSIIINDIEVKIIQPIETIGDISNKKNNYKYKASFYAKTLVSGYYLEKETFEEIIDKKSITSTLNIDYHKERTIISIDNLYYLRELGRGSYGKVYLVHNKNQFFALKTVDVALVTDIESSKYYKDEKKILSNLDHPFIVQLYNTFKQTHYIFFLMEYIEGQTLKKCLEHPNCFNSVRNVSKITFIASILCSVLSYLQRKRIIHRDLKPANLIVNSDGYIKVIDFGVAKNLMDKDSTNTLIGTVHYMSPEMLNGKPYSFSTDIWAIGVIIYEVFYGELPFGIDLKDPKEVLNDIRERRVILPYDPKTGNINEAIKNLLHKKSNKRMNLFSRWKEWEMFEGYNFSAVTHKQAISPLLENGTVDLFQMEKTKKTSNNQLLSMVSSSCHEIQPVNENELDNDLHPFSNFITNNMFATTTNIVDIDIMDNNKCLDAFSDF